MSKVRLAVDVAGGDFGASVLVRGVLDARRVVSDDLTVCLCGDRDTILRTLRQEGAPEHDIDTTLVVEHCPEVITADDRPSRVWKAKRHSSAVRCIGLQREGKADASVSAGHTGVLLAAAVFILGRQEGVRRPALAAFLPTTEARETLLLDVGANLNCRAGHLVAFGLMGQEYLRRLCGIENPRVALLNVGTERTKGTRAVSEAARHLSKRCEGYSGYIEGSEVLLGHADVVVCDGFVGNVLLKACESYYSLVEKVLGSEQHLLGDIHRHLAILNAENYGAVPLLGVKGVVMKAHGSSSAKAFAHAILKAVTTAKQLADPPAAVAPVKGLSYAHVS